MSEQQRVSFADRLSGSAWHLGLECVFWSAGGLLVSQLEPTGPAIDGGSAGNPLAGTALIGLLLVIVAAIHVCLRRRGNWLLFSTGLHAMLLVVSAFVAECAVRQFTPAWPARDLHGVPPEVWAQSQTANRTEADNIGFNSWGQRDRERALTTPPDTLRIACVGDSFLEEGALTPVSLLIERHLSRADVEVVNLGVSATGPDEYYERTRGVALPLQIDHCVLFVYAGNDFATPGRTLESYGGVAAVGPRTSLLRICGLSGINHVLTNRQRPVIRAWFESGDLAMRERQMHAVIQGADDEQLRLALLNASPLPPQERARLVDRLWNPQATEFFEILRHPDERKFRSYYLSAALWSASVGGGQWEGDSPESAVYWTDQTVDACRDRGVTSTVVIIPDAFQVDPRMIEQWSPLADMQHLTQPTRTAAEEFREQGLALGWDIIDLHEVLEGVGGTYLNLDGHWSDLGAETAAESIAEHLRTRFAL